jgi:formylglycine-generating enzyme required for sulfatase activity/tRNA A-37 threonylcarbamoyl transferase component Bud32
MSQCLNPDCLHKNLEATPVCQKCGTKLLLGDRYRALSIIGKGGFGRTFLAIDEFKPSKPKCVIKQFLPKVQGKNAIQKATELFATEAIALDELGKHEQIPELLAYFNQEERQYLVQEFVDGDNLLKELQERGKFDEQQIRTLLEDMLCVLQFVHANNTIHRDIKPENIIRRRRDGKLILVDFGAVKANEFDSLGVTGTIIGSAGYIAPEQARGKPQFSSDLYSLGVTCLHLLTNVTPLELFDLGENLWIWRDYLTETPINEQLGQILDRLVENATKKRFASVEEVVHALKTTTPIGANGQNPQLPTSQSPQSPPSPPPKPKPKPNLQLKIFEFKTATVTSQSSIVGKQLRLQSNFSSGNAKYIAIDLGEGINIELIAIPGGQFLMGSPEKEAERGTEEDFQHEVTIPAFLLGKYPVTQAQWQALMKNNPSRFQRDGLNRPVERVSWFESQLFCQKLSELAGTEIRLPSEAEWEYACRAGTKSPFCYGATLTTELANYNGEFTYTFGLVEENRSQTTEVGIFPANPFGLYDLHGNVAEWCADTWHDCYAGAPVDASAWISGKEKEPRVLRGGSWLHVPGSCRCASRLKALPNSKSDAFGFRIVASV